MNRKRQRILGIIMVLLMAFSLAACKKKEADPVDQVVTESTESIEQKQEEQSEPTEEESKSEEIPEESEPESEEPEETPAESEEVSESSEEKKPELGDDYFAAPSNSGKLHVEGISIVDENGNAVQLRGISTHGIGWFPEYVNQQAFHEFRNDWQANVVRLAMYTGEGAGYCTGGDKAKLKQLVEDGVKYATDEDLYVIIDWHILSDNDPTTYQSEAEKFFDEMSAKYADYNNVLYEICNEPNGGTSWSTIKKYAESVIGVIRANDPDAIVIVGTPNWSQYVDQAAADPITDYDNVMYTLHFYADTHKDSLRNTAENALKAGLPLFVSEFGICDASGNGAVNETEANKWVKLLDTYGVSYVMWNLSNKAETSSMIASSCKKTSGWSESELSTSGKWLYHVLTGGSSTLVGTIPDVSELGSGTGSSGGGSGAGGGGYSGGAAPGVAKGTVITGSSNGFTYTLTMDNSWGEGSACYYQYVVAIRNDSGASVSSWSVDIPFSTNVSLDQGWCGSFSASGTTLHISNADWNGSLSNGSSAEGIGVIVYGDSTMVAQ